MRINPYLSLFQTLVQALPRRSYGPTHQLSQLGEKQPVVILVSGFGATHRSLSIMSKRLGRDGYHVVVVSLAWSNISDGIEGLYRLARQLDERVRSIRENPVGKQVPLYIVAHSAGGLVARYYVQFLGGEKECDGLITLATPHTGTWYAGLGFLTPLAVKGRCLFHMLPISPFIRKLNRAPLPTGLRLVNIYSGDDLLCSRDTQSLAAQEMINIGLAGYSHTDFLVRKYLYQVMLQNLRAGDVGHRMDAAEAA